MKVAGYGAFETLRRQNTVLRGTAELNSGIQLAAWYSNCDTMTVHSDHHALSLYVADGYENCQKTPHGQEDGDGPGHFCLMPKRDESVWDIHGDLSFVRLYCTNGHLCHVGEEVWDHSPANFTLQKKTLASDDKVTVVYHQFLPANSWRQPANQLTLSAANSSLSTRLIQHYSIVQWRLSTVTGGLAPDMKRHMLTWVNAHLGQPLTLADLAQQAGLSGFRFARMFCRSLNTAPRQYAMQQQMARAQNLLCHSTLPLTEIAPAYGFSSVSHLSHQVEAATGLMSFQLGVTQRG